MDNDPAQSHLRHNIIVNVLDGAFFGFAVGFASFVTIIPLFVSTMTDSAILIGLIPAIHAVGWQFPQLFIAKRVSRLARFKPMVLWYTIQERLPFLGLAAVAWWLPSLEKSSALIITFFLLIWQGLGAGFTANPWQSMIAKIIPSDIRGRFFGIQAAAANLLASLSAILAGLILDRVEHPQDYVYCFLLASLNLAIGSIFLDQHQMSVFCIQIRGGHSGKDPSFPQRGCFQHF
jgi:Na+/melibiose symporter-like transporter